MKQCRRGNPINLACQSPRSQKLTLQPHVYQRNVYQSEQSPKKNLNEMNTEVSHYRLLALHGRMLSQQFLKAGGS